MGQEGSGQPSGAGKGYVRFTRESGARIAKAVRTVEAMPTPSAGGMTTEHPMPTLVTFRVGTFTGSWAKSSSRTVTIQGTTNTLSASNFFATLGSATGGPFNCAVLKGGTTWVVIAAECPT